MTGRPLLLDLFCGAGGAAVGYHRAGFDVVGVDVEPQPDYPFEFLQMNALGVAPGWVRWEFDAVHASPPCQNQAAITKGTNAHRRHLHPDLYPETAALLRAIGLPYVIENPSARPDLILCGEMFGLAVLRHRRFEIGGWEATAPAHRPHRGRVAGMRHGQWFEGPYFAVYGQGGGKGTVAQWQAAMGIDWTANRKSIAEAIPPAYTELIGRQLAARLREAAA